MEKLPREAAAQARIFKEDNEWLKRESKKQHTIVAVIVHELINHKKENDDSK